MRKSIFSAILILAGQFSLNAQSDNDFSAIKLFVDPDSISIRNTDVQANLQNRLYTKIVQLINQTGIAEIGYSNFWVLPKFDVLSTSVDQAGIGKVYMAECELFISVARREYSSAGGAIYNSVSKRIIGSALDKEGAVSNAINSISPSDKDIVNFFNQTKIKINDYFKAHCKDVVKEAEQAYKLNDYGRSIALYFSVPSSAPCYPDARDASVKVYKTFMNDRCRKYLVELKTLVAAIQTKDKLSMDSYTKAMGIIKQLDPSSTDCYAEAVMEISKIEKRFDESQKHEWDMEQKRETNNADIQKGIVKAMSRISTTYQPSAPASTIIISK